MSFTNKTTVLGYFREAKQELEKVSWPTQKEVIYYSIIVIVSSLLVGAYFGGVDYILQLGLGALVGLVN